MPRILSRPCTVRLFAAGLALVATPAAAQQAEPGCAGQAQLADACQLSADLLTHLVPQLGAAVAGGSATLGQSGMTGGLGHVSFAFRAAALSAAIPDLSEAQPSPGAAVERTLPVSERLVLFPQLDLSIGLFRGVPVGATNVGALDLLVSGTWLPDVAAGGVDIAPEGAGFRVGWGARLVLLQEGFGIPSLSATYMRRDTPATSVVAAMDAGRDTVRVSELGLTAGSWRVMAGQTFYGVGLAAGFGQDRIEAGGDLTAVVRDGELEVRSATTVRAEREFTRTNAFANVTLPFRASRLVLEVGRAWGGELPTLATFEGSPADAARTYGSLGLRLGF